VQALELVTFDAAGSWFDRYLRLDTSVDTGPEFAYFRDWVAYDRHGSAAPAYGTAAAFPAESSVTFTMSGASDLVGPGSTAAGGSAIALSPAKGQPAAYTETSNFQCNGCTLPGGAPSPFTGVAPSDPPCVAAGCEFADFTSPSFTRDVVTGGVPTAHLHTSSLGGGRVARAGGQRPRDALWSRGASRVRKTS